MNVNKIGTLKNKLKQRLTLQCVVEIFKSLDIVF